MVVFWVNGKKGFTPCKFILTDSGDVFCDVPGDGFFKHPTFDKKALADHLLKMIFEGFSVDNASNEAETYAAKIENTRRLHYERVQTIKKH